MSATKDLQVLVKGLEMLPDSSEWKRIGTTNAHPNAWFGTHGTITALMDIARAFLAVTGRLLEINDISLERGGLLDVTGSPKNWSPPHNTHRNGRYADIGIRSSGGIVRMRDQDRPVFLELFDLTCPDGFRNPEPQSNGSNHYHTRCEGLGGN